MFIKQELADIQSENMYNEHYENKIETNTENAQNTTVTELKDVEEEILHTDETEYNTDNIKTEVEEDEVEDVNNVSMVMENEDYKELYKCHIIKEELVVGPTIVQEDGVESEVSDLPSSSVVSLTCLPDTSVSELKTTAAKHVCLLCNKSFVNNSNLQRHLQHLHNQKTFDCEICSIKFTTKLLLDKHFLRHTEERPFNCDECGKKFKTKSNLFQHKRLHFKSHMCELCHKTFALRCTLVRHRKSCCKKPKDEPIICQVCNKSFKKNFILKVHLLVHSTDRPFSCDVCHKNFKYKSALIKHIQLHDRLLSCISCNESFTQLVSLKHHMRKHTEGKPYECPDCNKLFAFKYSMLKHVRRHTRNIVKKNFTCDVCLKKFPHLCLLKYHMRTHTNEKHFSCHLCPKKFSHKRSVYIHYRNEHPNATYECKDTEASIASKVWDEFVKKKTDNQSSTVNKIAH